MNNLYKNGTESQSEVKVSISAIKSLSVQLDKYLQEYITYTDDLDILVKQTAHYWHGDNADDYRAVFDRQNKYIKDNLEVVKKHFAKLKEIYTEYEQVQQSNLELIQSLSTLKGSGEDF